MNAYLHLICVAFFFAVTLPSQIYMFLWLTNTIVPVTIDNKPSSWNTAILLPGSPFINNLLLIMVFVIQHCIFARRPVKDTITACLPDGFERIVFNVTTALVMYVMFLLWEPLPHVIWDITIPWLRYTVIVVRVSFILLNIQSVGVFSLDGILDFYAAKQPLSCLMNKAPPKMLLNTTGLYGIVRHPGMSFFIGVFFITPTMTSGQLLFAITMTIYTVLAVLYLEERDLVHHFGSQYEEYQKTTPAFIPSLWRSHKSATD